MNPGNEFRQLLLAWQFLTRVPLPAALAARIDAAAAGETAPPVVSARYFATIGLVIGLFAAGIWWVAAAIWPPLVAVVIAMGATLWLTGAFHEDGLADTCDGLIGHVGRDRAFAIMRDSRIGTYGACGLWTVLSARLILLASLPAAWVPWALIIGQGISRAASMTMMARLPCVADAGSSKLASSMAPVRGRDLGIGWGSVAVAIAAAVITAAAGAGPVVGAVGTLATWLLAVAAVLTGTWALGRWFIARLGGYSGDCLGATQQLTELLCLASVAACVAPRATMA